MGSRRCSRPAFPRPTRSRWSGSGRESEERYRIATQAVGGALVEADRRKDEFLATRAHELRNPRAPIRSAACYLRGRIELRRSKQRLEGAVRQAIEAVLPVIEEAGHTLDVHIAPDHVRVDADATRVAQAVLNLLKNAARCTPPGGRIQLFAGREAGEAVLRVRDDGLGIGLALTRRLVELHGGTVEAEIDGAGRGSLFTIRPQLSA
jgi:signal transduction histidine kinase